MKIDGCGSRPGARRRGARLTALRQQRQAARRAQTAGTPVAAAASASDITIAMITHEAPGDTFWDKIRAGAEAGRARTTASTLKYSNNHGRRSAGDADPERGRQQGGRHRGHAGHPGRASARRVKKAVDAGIPAVAFNSGINDYTEVRHRRCTSARTRTSPARPWARGSRQEAGGQAPSV